MYTGVLCSCITNQCMQAIQPFQAKNLISYFVNTWLASYECGCMVTGEVTEASYMC